MNVGAIAIKNIVADHRDASPTFPDKSSIRSLTIGERAHLGFVAQALGSLTRLAYRTPSLPPRWSTGLAHQTFMAARPPLGRLVYTEPLPR